MPPKKKRQSTEKKEDKDPQEKEGEKVDENDAMFDMKVDEKILAYHRNMLYEAKVVDRKLIGNPPKPNYFIHYKGWNVKWDEWILDDRIKKWTADNLKERAELKGKSGKENGEEKGNNTPGRKPSKTAKKRKKKASKSDSDSDDSDDDTVEQEKPKKENNKPAERLKCEIKIKIPGALKKQLVNDWEWVTRDRKLADLPKKKHSVTSIMDDYLTSKKRVAATQKITDEVVQGIKQYFDKAVGRVLLYKFERPQFKELNEAKKGTSNCDIYGAEHLLRLFVKLPELLASTDMEKDEITVLQGKIGEIVRFIDKKRGDYFSDPYVTTDKDYHEKASQETI